MLKILIIGVIYLTALCAAQKSKEDCLQDPACRWKLRTGKRAVEMMQADAKKCKDDPFCRITKREVEADAKECKDDPFCRITKREVEADAKECKDDPFCRITKRASDKSKKDCLQDPACRWKLRTGKRAVEMMQDPQGKGCVDDPFRCRITKRLAELKADAKKCKDDPFCRITKREASEKSKKDCLQDPACRWKLRTGKRAAEMMQDPQRKPVNCVDDPFRCRITKRLAELKADAKECKDDPFCRITKREASEKSKKDCLQDPACRWKLRTGKRAVEMMQDPQKKRVNCVDDPFRCRITKRLA